MRTSTVAILLATFGMAGCANKQPVQAAPSVLAPVPAEARLAALADCPPFGDIDLAALPERAWQPPASLENRHVELRRAQNLDLPQGRPRILSLYSANHHGYASISLAATRRDDGRWTVSAVGERNGVSAGDPPTLVNETWTKGAAESAELDAILADECLYAEPASVDAVNLRRLDGGLYQVMGAAETQTEIDTGRRVRVARMHFGNWGRTGRLMRLVGSKS